MYSGVTLVALLRFVLHITLLPTPLLTCTVETRFIASQAKNTPTPQAKNTPVINVIVRCVDIQYDVSGGVHRIDMHHAGVRRVCRRDESRLYSIPSIVSRLRRLCKNGIL